MAKPTTPKKPTIKVKKVVRKRQTLKTKKGY
jgi:hypothetical protein